MRLSEQMHLQSHAFVMWHVTYLIQKWFSIIKQLLPLNEGDMMICSALTWYSFVYFTLSMFIYHSLNKKLRLPSWFHRETIFKMDNFMVNFGGNAKLPLIFRHEQVFVNQRTIGPENAHLKPDPGVLSHHEMTLTLNTHTPLLNS